MEPPKPYIIDSNRPQHHAVSAQLNRAGRRGKHRGSTIEYCELRKAGRAAISDFG
jgi:hypothetical protein